MLGKLNDAKGFTFIELMVAFMVVAILSSIYIVKFTSTQDREKIVAAEAQINSMRKALGLFEVDHASYHLGTINNYEDFVGALVDSNDEAYMVLPDTTNFSNFKFAGNDTTYKITLNARDNKSTAITATPKGITKQ